jgi:hypothetical protein
MTTTIDKSHIPHCIRREAAILKESSMGKQLRILRDKLIAIAGDAVVLPMIEDDIDILLQRGDIIPQNYKPKMMEGAPCQCHSNVARLYEANPDRMVVCTGYGLSDDDLWRPHSWGWDKRSRRIVETTESREIYWGVKLAPNEAEVFCSNNW